MSEVTERFRQLLAEKRAAKERALAAMGAAMLAEAEGRDATELRAEHAEYGRHGIEGQKFAEAEQLAIETLAEHPEWFVFFEGKSQEHVVALIDTFRARGLEDDLALAEIYELAKWERQNIGGRLQARVRLPHPGRSS